MVYVLLANGFEEIEALTPVDIMRRAGIEVKTVTITDELEVLGAHNIKVEADIKLGEINREKMDLLMLPGGAGHVNLDECREVHDLINYAVENGKYVAAICASPSIIGKMGILKGKKATAFPGFEKFLKGAEVVADKVVVDGNIITAKGAGASAEFGFSIVEKLIDKKTADQLKETMQY